MQNITVGVPSRSGGWGFQNYTLTREGNHISVTPPDTGRRGPREGFDINLGGDQVTISGPERQWRVTFTADGATVDNPANDGRRSGGADMVIQAQLRPEQYQSFGLSIASSLIGIPLPADLLS